MSQVDTAAAAEAIIKSASAVCDHVDHLNTLIQRVSIPEDYLTDTRDAWKATYETEDLARAFLYGKIKGLSQSELANRLHNWPALLKRLGFNEPPTQQTLSKAWRAFDSDTRQMLEAAAVGIAHEANEHDIIPDALVPTEPDEEDDESEREHTRRKANKSIKLARKHAFPEFESGRALNREYEDEAILNMVAQICANNASAHSEGEYGWLADDDSIASGDTILRVLKAFATPDDDAAQYSFDELADDDMMPGIDRIRDEVLAAFDAATDNIMSTIRGDLGFDDRKTVAAIDITYERFWPSPWIERGEGIVKTTFPEMVSGYRKDGEYKRGYKYATITLVGEMMPIVLGVEPVKENSKWESDDAPSYSKARLVSRLLDRAQEFADIDEVVFDAGFYSYDVYAAVADRGLDYISPVPKYTDDLEAIEDIKTTEGVDAGVVHDVPVMLHGAVHHQAEFIYAPVDEDADHGHADSDGNYGAFITNRDHVSPDEITAVTNQYSRRWDIENQYKAIGKFLPRTSSTDYRVRFCNYALTALIYNLWRLVDFLIKVGKDVPLRATPEISCQTFVRRLGDFLREID